MKYCYLQKAILWTNLIVTTHIDILMLTIYSWFIVCSNSYWILCMEYLIYYEYTPPLLFVRFILSSFVVWGLIVLIFSYTNFVKYNFLYILFYKHFKIEINRISNLYFFKYFVLFVANLIVVIPIIVALYWHF